MIKKTLLREWNGKYRAEDTSSKYIHQKNAESMNNTCIEGNGTPLQYSCLENLMDGGAW